MADNPYSTPNAVSNDTSDRSIVSVSMFWLTAILGVVVLGLTASTAYKNIVFALQNGGQIHPYILSVICLMAVCALVLFYSAFSWSSRRVIAGILSFLAAGIAYFVGPWLLLTLLIG